MTFWPLCLLHAFDYSQIYNFVEKKHCSENYCNCIVILRLMVMSVWYIINVSISAEKLTSVRLFLFQYLSRWLNNGALHGWKFPLTYFPIVSRSDLDTCPNRRRGKDKIRKFWPQPKIGDLLTSDDLPMWFNCIMWYVIFRGLHNTHFEWWTAMTERF